MGDENAVAGFGKNCRHGVADNLLVKSAGVGRHLAEELLQRPFILRHLHAGEKVGPVAQTEIAEPQLIHSSGGNAFSNSGLPGLAAAGLVYKIGAVAAVSADEVGANPGLLCRQAVFFFAQSDGFH